MSRVAPALPENLSTARKSVAWEKEIEVQLITRLFGGGARPREIDERSWLRPAALKGALRFWWRATHAHLAEYDSLKKLKEREDLLFGSAARFGKKDEIKGGPGWLSVEVENPVFGPAQRSAYEPQEEPGKAVGITYYPAAAQNDKEADELGLPGREVRAKIRLRLDEIDDGTEKEILLALQAFFLLGGVGARTRRGAGALAPLKQAPAEKLGIPCEQTGVEAFLSKWVAADGSTVPPGVFSLARARWVVVGKPRPTQEEAHEKLLSVLRDFRQRRPHPDDWRRGKWGQTEWPEPYAIRLEVGTWSHKEPAEESRAQFPRALLGLPIVFMFHKDDTTDPGRHTLIGKRPDNSKIARFASPLLLRPIEVWGKAKGGVVKEFLPVALFTEPTLPADTAPYLEPTPRVGDPRRTLSEPRTFSETSIAQAAENANLLAQLETAFKALSAKKK